MRPNISDRIDERVIWTRRFWNNYYLFEYSPDSGWLYVFKNMYNPERWQDEWTEVHKFRLEPK